MVSFIAKTNETVATRLPSHSVRHDLGRLARRESGLEERDEDKFVNFWSQVADENAKFGAAVVTVLIIFRQYQGDRVRNKQ